MPSNWKNVERRFCRDLGGERTGPMGRHLPDCTRGTYPLSVEVKTRKQIPKWLSRFWEQTETECYEGFIPVLILHPHGADMDDALVLMRYGDLKQLKSYYQRRLDYGADV